MKTRLPSSLLLVSFALLAAAACDSSSSSMVSAGNTPTPTLDEAPLSPEDLSIGDFEGQSLTFLTRDGSGQWIAAPDGAALAVEPGGADGSSSALHLSATGAASVAAVLSPGDSAMVVSHDLSSCGALELWAKHGSAAQPGLVEIVVESAAGNARASFEPSSEWERFSFELAGLEGDSAPAADGEGGAAGAAPTAGTGSGPIGAGFELRSVRSVRFEVASGADLWVDEVSLTGCELPNLNPPLPEPPALGSKGPPGSPVAVHGQLRVEQGRIVDQNGAPFQLRGVSSMWLNQSAKPYAWNRDALRFMRDEWKLTVIRAAMGVEDGPNAYLNNHDGMRESVETIVENALELGVYVIVDWHDHNATAHPAEARAFFDGMATKYGNEPNVIWETYNEPLKEPWSTALKPYHTSLVATIRAKDPDNLIVLGTGQWSQLVDEAARDPLGATNVLYTLHFYSCTHDAWLRQKGDQAIAQGLPIFITEFGATKANGGTDGDVCADEAQTWFAWMAQNGVSGAAWKLDSCADLTCLISDGAPLDGGWTDQYLHGHGPLVREWIRGE